MHLEEGERPTLSVLTQRLGLDPAVVKRQIRGVNLGVALCRHRGWTLIFVRPFRLGTFYESVMTYGASLSEQHHWGHQQHFILFLNIYIFWWRSNQFSRGLHWRDPALNLESASPPQPELISLCLLPSHLLPLPVWLPKPAEYSRFYNKPMFRNQGSAFHLGRRRPLVVP